jgi:hypothetical protein
MATHDVFAENRYNPKKQDYNKTENYYFYNYEPDNKNIEEQKKEQKTKQKQSDAEKTEENIKAEAYNFVETLE